MLMECSAQQLRELLRLAASLRSFAAAASEPAYVRKLLHAAADVEARAHFLAEHGADPSPPDPERQTLLHASVDMKI
jgi:hypothetical protein